METIILFALSFIIGYYLFLVFSHPEKKKHKIPAIKYKNIEILPNCRIHFRSKTYHFHHWLILSVFVTGFFMVFDGMPLVKGVAFGGILQGLSYKDRFKIRLPRQRVFGNPQQY